MKQTIKNVLLVAVLMLVATMSIASAEESPSMYFVPADGTGICGETSTVDLMVNTSLEVTGIQAYIYFDNTCVNITDVDYTGSPWQPLGSPVWHHGEYVSVPSLNTDGVDAGVHKVATLTIDCTGCNCMSELDIVGAELADGDNSNLTVYNGTFTCNEPDPVAEISIGNGSGVVTIPITVTNADNVGAMDVTLNYNTSVANITGVTDGEMETTITNLENVSDGWIRVAAFQTNETGLSGDFTLLNVSFEPVGNVSSCPLTLSVTTFVDGTAMNYMNYTISNGTYSSSLNGDVNEDGLVDATDVMLIAKYVVGLPGYGDINKDAADVTGDGKIDIADAMFLAKHIVGIEGFDELR